MLETKSQNLVKKGGVIQQIMLCRKLGAIIDFVKSKKEKFFVESTMNVFKDNVLLFGML